jgi:hypothetical protein
MAADGASMRAAAARTNGTVTVRRIAWVMGPPGKSGPSVRRLAVSGTPGGKDNSPGK